MPSVATIVAEKHPDGNWNARFAHSVRFSGNGNNPISAVSRFIESFGWEKVDIDRIAEVNEFKQDDYSVFRVPLNDLGRLTIRNLISL